MPTRPDERAFLQSGPDVAGALLDNDAYTVASALSARVDGRPSAPRIAVTHVAPGPGEGYGTGSIGNKVSGTAEAIVAAAPVPIITVDDSSVIQTWNPAAERTLGWPASEACGRLLPTLITNDAASGWKLFDLVLGGRSLLAVEVALIRRDHSRVLARLSAAPIRGPRDEVAGAVVVLGKVHDQMRLEEALREAEDRERLLTHLAGDLAIYVYRLRPTSRVEYVSPSATSMLGVDVAALKSHPRRVLRLVHPDDRRAALAAFARSQEHAGAHRIRWIRQDSSVLWSELRNIPVYDEAGNLVAVEGMLRDVSRQHRGMAPIARVPSADWSQLVPMVLFEAYPDGTLSLAWVNDSGRASLGIVAGAGSRHSLEELQQLPPGERQVVGAALAQVVASGRAHFSVHWLCSDSRRHLLSVQCVALPGAALHCKLIIASIMDAEPVGEPQHAGNADQPSARAACRAPAASRDVATWQRLTLHFPAVDAAAARPPECPHCGCEILQRHQTTMRRLRDLPADGAQVVRYRCTRCRRTFSQHPVGVGRRLVSAPLSTEAAVLYGLGLSATDISRALAEHGVTIASRSVLRLAGDTGKLLRASRPPGLACVLGGQKSPASRHLAIVESIGLASQSGAALTAALLLRECGGEVTAWLRECLEPFGVLVDSLSR